MLPSSPADVISAILAATKTSGLLPSKAKIEAAPGALTESWIARTSLPHGAALLALTGITKLDHETEGTRRYELALGFFFFPKGVKMADVATDLANQAFELLRFIDRNSWGFENARWPTGLTCRNVFSPTLADKQSGLWLLDWRQRFDFDEEPESNAVVDALFGRQVVNG